MEILKSNAFLIILFVISLASLIGVIALIISTKKQSERYKKMLEKLGVHIIDTDVIAHEIVEPNSDCLNELVDYFGDSILNDDKTLNRKKLASIAFSDKQKTEALSNITHKYIKAEVVKDINTTDAEFT